MVDINRQGVGMTTHPERAHISVMPREILDYLRPAPGGCYLDATVGLGGHTRLLAEQLQGRGRIIGFDRDAASLELARQNLAAFHAVCDLRQANFKDMAEYLSGMGVTALDGIVMDLGISSYQLDSAERGFSFQVDGPLDMRMDQTGTASAADLLNTFSEEQIADIIFEYGEERFARRIARRIVERRRQKPYVSSEDLRETVLQSLPRGYQRHKIHPATRTFQALRIAVNQELGALDQALDQGMALLKPGGRMCVLAFHSLEDRIVKEKFRTAYREGRMTLILRKPLRPSEDEVKNNARARSARLRVAERKREP